jgi:hypothetical protein
MSPYPFGGSVPRYTAPDCTVPKHVTVASASNRDGLDELQEWICKITETTPI